MFSKNNKEKNKSTRYSFGSTSAIITNLALIIGLDTTANAKLSIIGSLMVIALADNISDSLGIHIYQESEGMTTRQVWISTLTNFISRLFISLGFIFIILFLPLSIAISISIIYGLLVLSVVTFTIAKNKGISPWHSIIEHLVIAGIVIFASKYFGTIILNKFRNI